jgi:hypothetical protein
LPTGASKDKPAPVVINIGGMQNAPYLGAGIAIAQFDYTTVAADSTAKTGAFWDVYKGRDIGKLFLISKAKGKVVAVADMLGYGRRLDGLGMGFPSNP